MLQQSQPIEFGGSAGHALVSGAGSALAYFAASVPWLID